MIDDLSRGVFFGHSFGERFELPIPLSYFIVGGAAVVAATFFLVVRRQVSKANIHAGKDEVPKTNLNLPAALISFLIFAGLVLAGFFGSQEVSENILPVFFWLIAWIVIPLCCGIIGNWTQALNPFANIAKIMNSNSLRQKILGRKGPLDWSKTLGWWPATALIFFLGCAELIYNQTFTTPSVLAVVLITYLIISALAGFLYGSAWLKKGEVFSVLYYTWGKMGYLRFGSSGLKGFAGGLVQPFEASFSRITFVLLLLVTVSFDGLISTPLWNSFAESLPESSHPGTASYKIISVVVFAVLGAAIWAVFSLFALGVSRAGGIRKSRNVVLAGLLPSILPISFGYLLAHYIQYLMVNGQLFFPLTGNPVGKESWPIHLGHPFNDSYEVHTQPLPSSFYWYFALAIIILVHVIAILIAHRYLGTVVKDKARAKRSEYPWILAMVTYTMLSLWLLAQPLVKEESHNESVLQVDVAKSIARPSIQPGDSVGFGKK